MILRVIVGGIGIERLAPSGTLVLRQRSGGDHTCNVSHSFSDFVLPCSRYRGRRPRRTCAAIAQALKEVKTPDKPLVLKAQGSFFVGGEKVEQTAGELGGLGPGGPHHRQSDVRALHGAAKR